MYRNSLRNVEAGVEGRRSWLVEQRWEHLLFAHWPVEPERLRRLLPQPVEPDVRDGVAWLAIVPFVMVGTRSAVGPRRLLLPPIPELNVRTYVRVHGVPAVWFLSLDASSPFFAAMGRALYGLRYHLAKMVAAVDGERVHYLSSRGTSGAAFSATYGPCGAAETAARGSLAYFLVERYRLFSEWRGRLITAEVAHEPWPLQPAEARFALNRMAPPGLACRGEPLLHYSRSVAARISAPWPVSHLKSVAWRPSACETTSSVRRASPTAPHVT
jgi:uncharacterized protein YqjF (DUF2071 family)